MLVAGETMGTHPQAPSEIPNRNAAPERLELVRQFVNTLDIDEGQDLLARPDTTKTWFVDHQLLSPKVRLAEADRIRAVEFREALRELLSGHTLDKVGPGASKRFDGVVRDIPMALRVDETGWVRVDSAGKGFDAALGDLLARTHASMENGTWQRLKACHDDTCRWAFYDHSKNRSSLWCDMALCGNRHKVSAFRQRQAATKPKSRVRKPSVAASSK
jgi:predicted RNA-binding Zn ribbon-like protein